MALAEELPYRSELLVNVLARELSPWYDEGSLIYLFIMYFTKIHE